MGTYSPDLSQVCHELPPALLQGALQSSLAVGTPKPAIKKPMKPYSMTLSPHRRHADGPDDLAYPHSYSGIPVNHIRCRLTSIPDMLKGQAEGAARSYRACRREGG